MKTAPQSAFIELMKTTTTLAGNLNISPFDIFAQDVDEVIILINYYLRIGAENRNNTPPTIMNERDESAAFWAAL